VEQGHFKGRERPLGNDVLFVGSVMNMALGECTCVSGVAHDVLCYPQWKAELLDRVRRDEILGRTRPKVRILLSIQASGTMFAN
jgi:hypothetical protein